MGTPAHCRIAGRRARLRRALPLNRPDEFTVDVLADLDAVVARSLPRWDLSARTSITLLNVSENATFALNDPGRHVLVLRVHRIGYSSAREIRSELAWMEALRRDHVIETACAVTGVDGDPVQMLDSLDAGEHRAAVAFERLPGVEPAPRDAAQCFERLGELTAAMHRHAQAWPLPGAFQRKRWDVESMLGPHACWGPWRAAIGLDTAGAATLEQAIDLIRARLARFGTAPHRFGLVHADLRLANLLIDGARLRIIDFDDCGFGWFLYDFAAAVSFIEDQPMVAGLLDAWCTGYRKISTLTAADRAEIPTLVVLRRILLCAWLASHAEVPFARELGAAFTAGTVTLARQLLSGTFLSQAATASGVGCS